jgi:hypothetical protein
MDAYVLICGAWGDIIVSLRQLKDTGISKIIAATGQKDIENFLLAQDYIDEVIKIDFPPELWINASIERNDVTDYISKKIGKQINLVNCSFNSAHNYIRYDLVKKITVDNKSKQWASVIKDDLPEDFILFYPYSLGNSAPLSVHWPYWKQFLKYLLDTKYNVVLCGMNLDFSEFDCYENFTDLSNATDSFQQVFALSHYAKQIITTHNGLSFYCSSNELKTIVIFNQHADNIFNGFNRSIQNVKRISYNDTILDAISIFHAPIKKDTFNDILSSFPYLHKSLMYENIAEKDNILCDKVKNCISVYSEKGFIPYIMATLILHHKRFIYHMKKMDEENEFEIIENIKYLSDKYECEIDFKILNQKTLNYDLVIE